MRYLRLVVLALLAVGLIVLALANRELVELHLLPTALVSLAGRQFSITLPLFMALYGALGLGIIIGFVWEWLRSHRNRARASRQARELKSLQRATDSAQKTPTDPIVALLDTPDRQAS